MKAVKSVGLIYTLTCNAECAHCCTNSGPDNKEKMGFDMATLILQEYARYTHSFSFSGGEISLFDDEFTELIYLANTLNKSVTCVTNASWAISPDAAAERILRWNKNGLKQMVISTDSYHQAFIPADNISHALKAAKKYGLDCLLQIVITKSESDIGKILHALGSAAFEVNIQQIPCVPAGRAKSMIPANEYYTMDGELQKMRCPNLGNTLVFMPNGDAYPCCSPFTTEIPNLKLGNAYQQTAVEMMQKLYSPLMIRTRREGFYANEFTLCQECKKQFCAKNEYVGEIGH